MGVDSQRIVSTSGGCPNQIVETSGEVSKAAVKDVQATASFWTYLLAVGLINAPTRMAEQSGQKIMQETWQSEPGFG